MTNNINKGFGFLFEMGCGKTLTTIAVMGAAFKKGKIDRVLVVAPTSVVSVWPKELDEYAAFDYEARTLLGEKQKRIDALNDLASCAFPVLKVAIINYESVWRDEVFEALKDYDADLIVCDESQRIKSHDSKQSKAMHELGDKARYKLILSGTPIQNNAIDIWSQYRFLDPTIYGDQFWSFKNHYCQMGGFNNKQIIRYRDMDNLIKKAHSVAFRITKEEAVDLPEQTFEVRNIVMSSKEKKLYDTLRRDSYAELENGGQVTATTVLTKLLRLQQLTGGFLVRDDEAKPELVSTAKLDALKDIIEDYVISAEKKLVIFARFLAEVEAIRELSEKLLPKNKRAVCIYGAVKNKDRGDVIKSFQEDPDVMIFIGQIDTAGTGITLTAADTCVYYSKTFNFATYDQSLSRIHRIGQRNTCTYIDLMVENSVDEVITKALKKKEDLASRIVDNWREVLA